MKVAVYPGSFDPITNGHIDVIERALKLVDKLIVLVGENPAKQETFSAQERVEMISSVLGKRKNVEVDHFNGLLLEYLKKNNISLLVRGLRVVSDFEYEFQRALINRKMDSDVETIFIMTKDEYSFLTSSIVKEIARFKGNVSQFVPKQVQKALQKKLD